MENDGRHIEPDKMQTEINGKYGFCLILLENITEENFTDVRAVIMDSLQNMTEITETAQTRLTESCEGSKAEELNEKITETRDLYTEVNESSTAAELKEILLNHEQTKVLNSVGEKIELLKSRVNKSENASDQQPNVRITGLKNKKVCLRSCTAEVADPLVVRVGFRVIQLRIT